MSFISEKDIKLVVKELLKSFEEKCEKLNQARKVFAAFDADIQLAIIQNNNPNLLEAINHTTSCHQNHDPCFLTLSNLYWGKLYNLVVLKMGISTDLKSSFFNKYCRENSSPFNQSIIRDALIKLDNQESDLDLINRLATQVGIYDSIFSFSFTNSPIRTKIHGVGTTAKRKIDICFEMIRTFEQIAPNIGLEINVDDSLLKFEEYQFDDAIKYLTNDLRYNRGEFFHVNQHLEIQLAKSSANIYVRFSDDAAKKLNQLYGR